MKHFCSFSEAIREGAKLRRRQSREWLLHRGATCAIGAGLDAMGLLPQKANHLCFGEKGTPEDGELFALYPYLSNIAWCSLCSGNQSVFDQIVHLNDDHRWTREAIADWLESEEEKLGFVTLVESGPAVEITQPAASLRACSIDAPACSGFLQT